MRDLLFGLVIMMQVSCGSEAPPDVAASRESVKQLAEANVRLEARLSETAGLTARETASASWWRAAAGSAIVLGVLFGIALGSKVRRDACVASDA